MCEMSTFLSSIIYRTSGETFLSIDVLEAVKWSDWFSHLPRTNNRHHRYKGSFPLFGGGSFPPLGGWYLVLRKEGISLCFGGRAAFFSVCELAFPLCRGKFPQSRTVYTDSLALRVLEELNGKSDKVVLVVMLEMLLLINLANALRSDL